MNDLRKFRNSLTSINIVEVAISVISDNELEIPKDRLEQGIRADNTTFKPYTPFTIKMKKASGGFISQSGNIALKDTGDFYRSFNWVKKKDYLELDATDPKTNKLFEAFGDDILDVSEIEANEILEQTREQFIEQLHTNLFK